MTPMSLPLRALLVGAVLAAAAPSRAETAAAPGPGFDACKLLTAAEVNLLLVGKATGKLSGSACTWTTPLNPRGLIVAVSKDSGRAAETSYAAVRAGAAKDAKVTITDEQGLGDRAFAAQTNFGIALFVVKKGRLLQLQYWAGGPGKPKDLEALRPVVLKALAAL
jgi:hypothetical protein